MNWLDIIIMVALGLFAFFGFRVGIIKSLFGLGGILVGVVLAGRFYGSLSGWFSPYIKETDLANIAGFALILGLVLAAAYLASFSLRKVLSLLLLGWADHVAGGILGLLMGFMFCGALVAVGARFPLGIEGVLRDSGLAPFLLKYFSLVLYLLPEEFDIVRRFFL